MTVGEKATLSAASLRETPGKQCTTGVKYCQVALAGPTSDKITLGAISTSRYDLSGWINEATQLAYQVAGFV